MNIVFQINGGLGKCIIATTVCKSIKSKYPESNLIVISGYPEVFLNNPHVNKSFAFGQSAYFYEDYIEKGEFLVFAHDPYLETGHLMQNEHLSTTWTRMFGLPDPGPNPELFFTEREIQFFKSKVQTDKPIMLMQTNGGAQGQELKYSWARDIPANVVLGVIEEFKSDYLIVHLKREDQPSYPGTTPISDNFRAVSVLISMAEKLLLMDSFGQHAAAALQKPASVLWVANSPKVFGYDLHTNLIANPFTKKPELRNSYLSKFDITGNPMQFPYNTELEIFNVDQVIQSLK